MKKIIIYYFSGTGNTWWIANTLAQQLNEQNHPVACYSIETLTTEDITEQIRAADHIVFGFPVYGSTAPKPMLHLLHELPPAANNQSVSIFATQALASGDSAYHVGCILARKGYSLKQAIHFKMMNNFHIPKFRFYRPKNDYRLDRLLQSALPKVEKLAHAILHDHKYMVGKNMVGRLLGNLQRSHIDQVMETVRKEFMVDTTRCTACGKCQRICPTQNIERCDGTYTFGDRCVLCMRCYSQCPVSAILIGEGTENVVKYPRYKGPGKDFEIHLMTNNRR